jgi:transcriptional regulator with XRE-family HTH domain
MSQSIIDAIKCEMSSKGISGAKLAELSGVSSNYVYMLLRGEHTPSLDILTKLLNALDLSLQVVPSSELSRAI